MKTLLFIVVVLLSVSQLQAQEQKSKKELKAEREAELRKQTLQLIEARTFEFIPDRAHPSQGRSISITSYRVLLEGDSIDSYLPYYGRAYVADYGATGSPLSFNGVIEKFVQSEDKKGFHIEFDVTPPNSIDKLTYRFLIFENGSASLNVNSNNRQPISFNGTIEEIKKE